MTNIEYHTGIIKATLASSEREFKNNLNSLDAQGVELAVALVKQDMYLIYNLLEELPDKYKISIEQWANLVEEIVSSKTDYTKTTWVELNEKSTLADYKQAYVYYYYNGIQKVKSSLDLFVFLCAKYTGLDIHQIMGIGVTGITPEILNSVIKDVPIHISTLIKESYPKYFK